MQPLINHQPIIWKDNGCTIHDIPYIILIMTKPCIYFQKKLLLKRTFSKNLCMIMVQATQMHRTRVLHHTDTLESGQIPILICQHHSRVYCTGGINNCATEESNFRSLNWWQYIRLQSVVDNTQKYGGCPPHPEQKNFKTSTTCIYNNIVILTVPIMISPRH